MPEDITSEESLEPGRNTMAAIAAGVLVVIAGFLVYNYFSRVGQATEPQISNEGISQELVLPAPEEIGQAGGEGEVAGEEIEQLADQANPVEESKPEAAPEAIAPSWLANDLSPNSINNGSYTVQSGDTLWEIAEARYGSGFEWEKVLEANKDKIGFLADGSQALIVPGQALTLP